MGIKMVHFLLILGAQTSLREHQWTTPTDYYLLIEPKRADQMNTDEVQLKARAASRWCGYANEHAKNNSNKLWFYLLVPHDAIALGISLANLKAEHSSVTMTYEVLKTS